MSRPFPKFTLLALATGSLLAAASASAEVKWYYHPVESTLNLGEPYVKSQFVVDMDLVVPDHGTVVLPSLFGQYKALDFLAVGLGFAYAISDEGDTFPGNIYLKLKSSACSNEKHGWNLCIAGHLGAGISVQDLADDDTTGGHLAAAGMVADQSLLRFMPEASVFEPMLVFTAAQTGTLKLLATIGASAGTPMSGPSRETVTGLTYGFELVTGLGDQRGSIEWAIGGKGMANINGLAEDMFAFVGGLRLNLKKIELFPYLRVLVPIAGDLAGVNAVISAGLAWNYLGFRR